MDIPRCNSRKKSIEKISFDSYLQSYLEAKEQNNSAYKKNKNKKPIDVLASIINFDEAEEYFVCAWMMEMVISTAITMMNKQIGNKDNHLPELSPGDASIETFEDRYLYALMELYNLTLITTSR